MTTSCPTCRAEAPVGARFCPACGARLEAERPEATERKVVTTLFADLVGFTALGERHDPEDVDVALRGYYTLARTVIERFGGVVEKFIGDAVVGLFGVPLAHEDDAERAVRAALELVAHLNELPPIGGEKLQVRAAVNTGLALVRLHARPEAGEGVLVGDAVNTAARLLAETPPMGVVVGEMTQRLASRVISFEAMTPRPAKGKAKPIARWLARGPIASRGSVFSQGVSTPMIGREVELGMLSGLLDRAIASQRPQFALIIGEAGIGKSRLVHEFGQEIDRRPGLMCTWRQGSCLPYGSELIFRALREIVCTHAGILQTDSVAAVEDKLARAIGGGDSDEETWLMSQLRPLIGLSAPEGDQTERFAAWLRFFETMARQRPTVLVFEDVHWASDQTLAFLAHLVGKATAGPLVVLATARPEFLDRHPGFRRYETAVANVHLKSLTDEETRRLVVSLAGTASEGLATLASERSGGNPLFAEELVRYLSEERQAIADHGWDSTAPGRESASATPSRLEAPASISALIAARLDALPAAQRALLSDAAVVGPVFWLGSVAAIASQPQDDSLAILRELEAREFVRRHGESAIGGDKEFAFWHALTREVAYQQLPRAARGAKHAAVAEWLKSAVGPRRGDVADLLAYHCWTALELAKSLGQDELQSRLRESALYALRLAGDNATRLDIRAAEDYYRRAAELATSADGTRADILLAWVSALHQAGRTEDALAKAEEATEILRGADDVGALAVALMVLSRCCEWLGDARARRLAEEALLCAERAGPSAETIEVLAYWVGTCSGSLDPVGALKTAERAMTLSATLAIPPNPRVVHFRGLARCDLGDISGLDDVRQSIKMAIEQGQARDAGNFSFNYAELLRSHEGPRRALRIEREALEHARRRSDAAAVGYLAEAELVDLWLLGDWATVEERAPEVERLFLEQRNLLDLSQVRTLGALLRFARGENCQAADAVSVTESLQAAGAAGLFAELDQFGGAALIALHASLDDVASAGRWLAVLEADAPTGASGAGLSLFLPEVIRQIVGLAHRQSDDALMRRVAVAPTWLGSGWRSEVAAKHTLLGLLREFEEDYAAAQSQFRLASAIWAELEIPFERAHSMLGESRCLLELGRTREAVIQLSEAGKAFATLRAKPALAEVEELLEGGPRAQA